MNTETPRRRGALRIYLGAAPGVGKTHAMLTEVHRRADRGTDVVVGVVETHGRTPIAELLSGLETVASSRAELDVDAVLERAPAVAAVDDLAHTNARGARLATRWQQIEVLLASSIDVVTTVDIGQLQSLGDVVEKLTGRAEVDTVPDKMVRAAEQVELVDITPQALRRRLADGELYPAERVDAQLGHYFKTSTLTGLRELALLWLADHADLALRRHRSEADLTDIWETRERVVAAITADPESETLIRRARRIANRAGAELLVVHVLRTAGLKDAPPPDVARFRRLTENLGASYHTVVGRDVSAALLDFARGVNATQLVIGTSRRSRWARLFTEGIGAAAVRDSGPIDVHIVTLQPPRRSPRVRPGLTPLNGWRRLAGWLLAIALPIMVTASGMLLQPHLNLSTDVSGYVIATVVAALVGGLGPALLSALAGGVLLNYFFVPPLHTFVVDSTDNIVTLIMMVIVGLLVALVVVHAARLAAQATHARTEATLLATYANTVLTHPDPVRALLRKVCENFGMQAAALLEHTGNRWLTVASVGADPCPRPEVADVDIAPSTDVHLALRGNALPARDRGALHAAAEQALLALRQQRMALDTAQAQSAAEAAKLRSTLLSALGHDLRSPLTSIKAAIGSLRDPGLLLGSNDTAELQDTIEQSTDRLTALVANLLDSSRLATGAVTPQRTAVGYDEIVARALAGLPDRDSVTVDVSESLPAVLGDTGLAERVVANLLDNALKHGRRERDGTVEVRGSSHRGTVELRIIDHGPGLSTGTPDTMFDPLQPRSDRDATNTGVGLGLSVAKGFTDAMAGNLIAEDTPGGGLTMVLSLPEAQDVAR